MNRAHGPGPTAVFVEDEQELRQEYAGLLKRRGVFVVECDNKESAVELTARHDPDVVILDLVLESTQETGDTVLLALRATKPSIGCVVLTAYSHHEWHRRFERPELLVDVWLPKDIVTADLLAQAVRLASLRALCHRMVATPDDLAGVLGVGESGARRFAEYLSGICLPPKKPISKASKAEASKQHVAALPHSQDSGRQISAIEVERPRPGSYAVLAPDLRFPGAKSAAEMLDSEIHDYLIVIDVKENRVIRIVTGPPFSPSSDQMTEIALKREAAALYAKYPLPSYDIAFGYGTWDDIRTSLANVSGWSTAEMRMLAVARDPTGVRDS